MKVTSPEIQVTSSDLWFMSSTSQVTSSSAWVSSSNPRGKSLSLYGTRFNLPVTEFKSAS